jgi:hypothetical protein
MTNIDRARQPADPAHRHSATTGPTGRSESFTPEFAALLRTVQAGGSPVGMSAQQLLSLQRTAGNRATRTLLEAQRLTLSGRSSMSALKKAVGLGARKHRSVADKVEEAATKSKSTKVVTVSDLDTQVSRLESMSAKLVKAHQPGDTASHHAALQVNAAAKRILGNLPDQESKASKLLGRTYPVQVKRLERIMDDTQLILDEARVANTRREAQNIYLEAGRSAAAGQPGALTAVTKTASTLAFDPAKAGPAPNAAVAAFLQTNGFASYEQAFEDAVAKKSADPRSPAEGELAGLQPELFKHTERSRSRTAAQSMGLSAAELAAIQTYTAGDYQYINPAAANDPKWLAANFPDLVDKPNKSLEEWAELQDQLAEQGQSLEQREDQRKQQLTAIREEGGLHTAVALEGLRKMPVWRGVAYRGEKLEAKRFYPRFVKDGNGFRPRQPTFTWKTITSISKSELRASAFMTSGSGSYEVLWEFEVTDGRDIEGLSVNRLEREVALLPGAEFAYGPIEVLQAGKFVEGFGEVVWRLRIKAKQIK